MIIYAPRASAIIYNFLKSNYKGGYYLLPVNICPIVPLVFRKANVDFKMIDIESNTLCIDKDKVLDHVNEKKIAGLLYAYTYGIETHVDDFFKQIKQKKERVKIIEDKCLMKPSFNYEKTSFYADLTLYSTGYSKYVDLDYGGFGIGKYGISYEQNELPYNPKALKKILLKYKKALNQHLYINNSEVQTDWLNNKKISWNKDEYERIVEKKIQEVDDHKSEINSVYLKNLPSEIIIKGENSFCWRFNIRVPQKEKLLSRLFENGLFASSHYQRVDGIFSTSKIEAPIASKLQEVVVNLFNDFNYTLKQAQLTCDLVNDHMRKFEI